MRVWQQQHLAAFSTLNHSTKALNPRRPAAGHLGALSVIAWLRSIHTNCPTYLTRENIFLLPFAQTGELKPLKMLL